MNRRQSLRLIAGGAVFAATPLTAWTALAQTAPSGPFQVPPLGYGFDALEPHIDAQTMMIHHDKHHAAYVAKLNELTQQFHDLGTIPIEKLLADPSPVPLQIRTAVQNNLGGHWNHSFFWDLMTPGGAKAPAAELKAAIDGEFGDTEKMKDAMNKMAGDRFGSGWAWLVVTKDNKLDIVSTANQDTPIALGGRPVIGVDVWEHAYYLKYQNRRADYLKAWWNTVNWDKATANFKKVKV
ncbi:MAG: superoxide dismutase, Fe-Mn family [Hyphomicrobiales bacterium]|jgi:Fe-Mn family superoxide dismutase|nr:superoxide dismutase, Fe-Mn family [Hyphomicrobiales bacterium]